jgi:hypothetical protein
MRLRPPPHLDAHVDPGAYQTGARVCTEVPFGREARWQGEWLAGDDGQLLVQAGMTACTMRNFARHSAEHARRRERSHASPVRPWV